MAAEPLENVKAPAGLRDTILAAYAEFKGIVGAGAPDKLFSTFSAASGSGVPSHDAGKAIDIVSDGMASRPYLIEFGAYLFATRPEVSVYFYPQGYQPHVHVGTVSGFGQGEWLAINKGAPNAFDKWKRADVAKDAGSIVTGLQKIRATYPAGYNVDWDRVEGWLRGEAPAVAPGYKAFLKKYWWVGVISVGLLLGIFFIFKFRKGAEDGYAHD